MVQEALRCFAAQHLLAGVALIWGAAPRAFLVEVPDVVRWHRVLALHQSSADDEIRVALHRLAGAAAVRYDQEDAPEDPHEGQCLFVRFDDEAGLDRLLAQLGQSGPSWRRRMAVDYDHHDFSRGGGVELQLYPGEEDDKAWTIAAGFSEDDEVFGNWCSWPLAIAVGEYLAKKLGGVCEAGDYH